MTNVNDLLELVQRGANGVGDVSIEAARRVCKIILEEDYLGMKGWPAKVEASKPAEKKVWAPRPNDKGYKMAAKKDGVCNLCTDPIVAGDDIYFKSGSGATHVRCKDAPAV